MFIRDPTIRRLKRAIDEINQVLEQPIPPGENGKSAYELAVDNGFIGTIQEWLDSLVGTDGIQGLQGDKGEEGSAENSLTTRFDETYSPIYYLGDAQPNSSESDSVWRIKRIDASDQKQVVTLFADGNNNFDNCWDDRLILNYS